MKKFEILDHTADTGLKVWGSDLAQLFIAAAEGMTHLMIEGEIRRCHQRTFSLACEGVEDLLHDWLSEINYLFQVQQMVFSQFSISHIDEVSIEATLTGEEIDPDRHVCCTEIKAITYHQLYVVKQEGKWQAQVIFDL